MDEWCGDRFDQTVTEERLFRCGGSGGLLTDRFRSLPTAVSTSATPSGDFSDLTSGQWWVNIPPFGDRPGRNLDGHFFLGQWYRVTADWGWPAVPPAIATAATLLAGRLYHRQATPLGLQDSDYGPAYISRYDADVQALIRPYRVSL